MNKKILTLLAAGFMGSLSVSAFAADFNPEPAQLQLLHQLKVGDQVLSVRPNYNNTADSLFLTTAPDDVTSTAYKKTLWSVSKSQVDNNANPVFTFTNYATGKVLSLNLTTGSGNIAAGQSAWLVQDDQIKAIKSGETYVLGLIDKENAEGQTEKHVAIKKMNKNDGSFPAGFTTSVYAPETAGHAAELLNVKQINGLYGTANVLQFEASMQGNPINGNPFQALAVRTTGTETPEELQEATEFNIRFTDGKYLVVDTLQWSNSVATGNYWKVTTAAKPTATTVNVANETILENGRSEDTYKFKMTLDVQSGYKIKIFPVAVPQKKTSRADGNESACWYGAVDTEIALSYAQFAGNNNVLYATSGIGKSNPALSKFGTVSTPGTLNGDYVYYVQDYNTHLNQYTKNERYTEYAFVEECYDNELHSNGTISEGRSSSTKATPNYMWYLKDGQLKNMAVAPYVYNIPARPWNAIESQTELVDDQLNTEIGGISYTYEPVDQPSYSGVITLIDEANGIYVFNTDTLKLTKGPKVADVQKTAYKKVSREDEVNGALSFRLKSVLGDDLYVITKNDGKLYVDKGDLDGAEQFKVTLVREDKVGNGLICPVYQLQNRTETKSITTDYENGRNYYAWSEDEYTSISFYATGVENEYKILNNGNAITANAATGLLEATSRCSHANVLFEFAKKDAPTYGAPKYGHVQITTLEDDDKMIAPQLDGFAALKSVGQILKSDVYTNDSLKLWLDTAYIEDEGSKPFYYLSSTAFNEPGAKRNFLINPLNREEELAAANKSFYKFAAMPYYNRAAFTPASVCGKDSLAIFENDTIGVHELNPAAILFQVVAEEGDEVYNIVSKLQYKNPDYNPEITDEDNDNHYPYYRWNVTHYLAQLNNVLFWTDNSRQAEVFVINRTTAPTANEAVEAESGVEVIAGQGVVTVQGAAGKVITVANILGQTIANQVAASDNVTIAAPAGVVVVTVDGEVVKTIVK